MRRRPFACMPWQQRKRCRVQAARLHSPPERLRKKGAQQSAPLSHPARTRHTLPAAQHQPTSRWRSRWWAAHGVGPPALISELIRSLRSLEAMYDTPLRSPRCVPAAMPLSVRALEWRLLFATLTGQPPACDAAAGAAAAPPGAPPVLRARLMRSRLTRDARRAGGCRGCRGAHRAREVSGALPRHVVAVAVAQQRSPPPPLVSQDVLALPLAAALLPAPPPFQAASGADAEAAALAAATAAAQHYAAVRASLGASARARDARMCANALRLRRL